MTDIKHKSNEQVSREEAAQRLIALGEALASGETLEIGTGDQSRSVRVADELRYEYETKSKGDRVEIEVELAWEQATATPAPVASGAETGTSATEQDPPGPPPYTSQR